MGLAGRGYESSDGARQSTEQQLPRAELKFRDVKPTRTPSSTYVRSRAPRQRLRSVSKGCPSAAAKERFRSAARAVGPGRGARPLLGARAGRGTGRRRAGSRGASGQTPRAASSQTLLGGSSLRSSSGGSDPRNTQRRLAGAVALPFRAGVFRTRPCGC